MNFIYTIISALLVIIFSTAVYATDFSADKELRPVYTSIEVITASWEREAEEDLAGKAALKAAAGGDCTGMDMFGSDKTIIGLRNLRGMLTGILESENSTIPLKMAALQALESIGRSVVTGLYSNELKAINNTDLSLRDWIPSGPEDFKGKKNNDNIPGIITAAGAVALPFFSIVKTLAADASRDRYYKRSADTISRENEIDHADLYRLFLYVRDNSGAAKRLGFDISFFRSPYSSSRRLLTSTQHKTKQNTANTPTETDYLTRVMCGAVYGHAAASLYCKTLLSGHLFGLLNTNIWEISNDIR